MTEAQQRRFYFPQWNTCAVANDWLMKRGRLSADLDAQRVAYATWPDPAGPLYAKVVTAAEQIARQEHRAVTADDLRHACNHVACGRISSGDLTNTQTTRVVNLFRLLTDPDDLDAVMDWLHPQRQEKQSFIAFLRSRANEATLIAIAMNAFDTREIEKLEIDQLRFIARQVKNRRQAAGGQQGRQFYRGKLQDMEKKFVPGPF